MRTIKNRHGYIKAHTISRNNGRINSNENSDDRKLVNRVAVWCNKYLINESLLTSGWTMKCTLHTWFSQQHYFSGHAHHGQLDNNYKQYHHHQKNPTASDPGFLEEVLRSVAGSAFQRGTAASILTRSPLVRRMAMKNWNLSPIYAILTSGSHERFTPSRGSGGWVWGVLMH